MLINYIIILVLLFEYVDFDFSLINAEKHLLKKKKVQVNPLPTGT